MHAMNTRTLFLLGALVATVPGFAAANNEVQQADAAKLEAAHAKVENLLTTQVDGTIVIEKDGTVGDYTPSTQVVEQMRPVLDKYIRAWRFKPVLVDGVAVRAQAPVRITLAAAQAGKDFNVRIDNVVFPSPAGTPDPEGASNSGRVGFLAPKLTPPRYPAWLARAGVGGRVLLGLRFNPDGSVKDVVAVQSMLFDVKGRDRILAQAIKVMEDSALRAARDWTVQLRVKDGVAPTPSELSAMTTVEYVMDFQKDHPVEAGTWRSVSRTPKREMPWLQGEKDRQDVGVADVRNGEMMPITSNLQLVTPMGGAL